MKIGEQIAFFRKARGMKQKDLADLIDVSRQYLCNIEKGNVLPSHKMLAKICAELRLAVTLQPVDR